MVQLPSSQLQPFKRYTSPPLPLHTLSVQREWDMVGWLWTKIFRFQHKRNVILLIFKFLIECCNSWVSILSRSRDTVTKKWSREPYTSLYIVRRVHLTTARFNISLSFLFVLLQKIVTYRQTNIPFWCSFRCWIECWKLEVHRISRSCAISILNFHPISVPVSSVWRALVFENKNRLRTAKNTPTFSKHTVWLLHYFISILPLHL